MKKLITLLFLLSHLIGFSNMANPVMSGTLGSEPFVNSYVDVIHENLEIIVERDFRTAQFKVDYFIKSDKDGVQVPFLFYASEYLDSFVVKVDGERVEIKDMPFDFNDQKFTDLSELFDYSGPKPAVIQESESNAFEVNLSDMIYFETDISKGKHKIEVNYVAYSWVDGWGEVNEYSFRYALSPAKYWRSFGTLNLKVDVTEVDKLISTNIKSPDKGSLDSIAYWSFDALPADILMVNFIPVIPPVGKVFIEIGSFGLSCILLLILVVIHVVWMKRFRIKYPSKKYSWVMILGIVIIPVLFISGCMFFHQVVDYFIGEYASRRHGYTFLVIIFYPLVLLLYWLGALFADKAYKRKYTKKSRLV